MGKRSVSAIKRFFCTSAGAYLSVLEKCPTQINKFHSMGVILWITAIMASLSGGYFFNTVFNKPTFAIIFGIFWGLSIFSLDRYIVTSLNIKKGEIFRNFGAFTRLLLALCLGIVVAKPIELKIFEKEITSQISIDNTSKINTQLNTDSTLFAVNNSIESLENEIRRLDNSLNQKKNDVDQYYRDYYEEIKGIGTGIGTGRIGRGREAKKKEEKHAIASQEYSVFIEEVQTRKKEIRMQKTSLKNKKTRIEENIKNPIKNNNGPLNQLNALHNLIKGEIHLRIANLIITLIFMLFELAPVLVKFSMKRGLYEELLEAQESLDKANLLEEMRFAQHKTEVNFKRNRSHYNGEVTFSEKLKNTIRENQKEFDDEVVNKHHKFSKDSLNNKAFVENKFNELVNRLYS